MRGKADKELTMKRTDYRWLRAVELTALAQKSNQEIIDDVGISKATFYLWKAKKEFYDDVMAKNIMIFKDMLPKALKTVNDAMDSGNAKVRLEAAKIVLEKTLPEFHPTEGKDDNRTTVNIQVNYE